MKESYNKFTIKDLEEAVNKIFDITSKEYLGLISPERATLERCAAYDNAYIHPEWNYLKYPQVYFDNPYSDSYTNKVFEEDIDRNCLIFVKRNE